MLLLTTVGSCFVNVTIRLQFKKSVIGQLPWMEVGQMSYPREGETQIGALSYYRDVVYRNGDGQGS